MKRNSCMEICGRVIVVEDEIELRARQIRLFGTVDREKIKRVEEKQRSEGGAKRGKEGSGNGSKRPGRPKQSKQRSTAKQTEGKH